MAFSNKSVDNNKKSKKTIYIKLCSAFMVLVLTVCAFVFAFSGNVASASDAILWGHKGKDGVTDISSGEIGRFDNDPALYFDEAWGEFVLGGINRVDSNHLPKIRPSNIMGTGVMDSYTNYVSKNVSVVRYKGGKDSNLGISVNNESLGYIKMDVNQSSGRYLYYSISVEPLSGEFDNNYGTFAVDINSSFVARTEKNNCGGFAYVTDPASYSDYSNWINGYEYGCIDLYALTGSDINSVKTVYILGTKKTKVLLNYLVLSNTHPTKIDVANGNIVFADGTEGDESPQGLKREYSDNSGKTGTGTLELSGTSAFSFENLVVDEEQTPYLYYSFEVTGTNSASVAFFENGKSNYIAKNNNSNIITNVTGCIKLETLLGKSGFLNISEKISENSSIYKSFTFGATGNIKVNYLFFSFGIDVSMGEHVIVKNANAINTQNAYSVNSFTDGALPQSFTYGQKGVYAEYSTTIKTNKVVDFCWYVNTAESFLNAKRLGTVNVPSASSTTKIDRNDALKKLDVNVSISVEKVENEIATTLKVKNPTKQHHGLYFFCLVVSRTNEGGFAFADTLDNNAVNSLGQFVSFTSGFCRLDIADNIVYHGVNKVGEEQEGIIGEDWLVYGTNSKVVAEFSADGEYVKYDTYSPASTGKFKNDGVSVCTDEYNLMSYSYNNVDSSSNGVNFNGWMLFEDTIRNPNGIYNHNQYKNVYKTKMGNLGIDFNDEVTHYHWTYPDKYSFYLNGEVDSVFHDTTLHLYTRWEIPVEAEILEVRIFVDEFGTTFMAKESQLGQFISATKNGYGKNNFINDVIYVAVAPKTDSTSTTIASGNGVMQYSVDGKQTWIDVNANDSLMKEIYTKETNMALVKNWYSDNTEYDHKLVYALKMDTDDLLKAFGKTDGVSGLDDTFEIDFRYIAGVSDDGGWFNFMGKALCGYFKFVPLKYYNLT